MAINNHHLAITMRKAAEFLVGETSINRLVVDDTDPDSGDGATRALEFADDVASNAVDVARSLAGVLDAVGILDHESRLMVAGSLLASIAVNATSPEDPAEFESSAFSVDPSVDPNSVFDKALLLAFSGLTLGMAQAIGDELDNRVEEEEEEEEEAGVTMDEIFDACGNEEDIDGTGEDLGEKELADAIKAGEYNDVTNSSVDKANAASGTPVFDDEGGVCGVEDVQTKNNDEKPISIDDIPTAQ